MATGDTNYGGLLGGPSDSIISPIIGQNGLSDARNNALLNFSAGLLQAGGPHVGVPTSLGQALAQGFGQAQSAYTSTLNNSLKGALTAQQVQSQKLAMQQNLQFANLLLGGNASAPPTATPTAPATQPIEAMPTAGQLPQASPIIAPPNLTMPGAIGGAPAAPSALSAPALGTPPSAGAQGVQQNPYVGTASMPPPASSTRPGFVSQETYSRQMMAAAALRPSAVPGIEANYKANGYKPVQMPDGSWIDGNDPKWKDHNFNKIGEGMTRDPNTGAISNAPGALQALGAQTGVTEAIKQGIAARYNFIPGGQKTASGLTVPLSAADASAGVGYAPPGPPAAGGAGGVLLRPPGGMGASGAPVPGSAPGGPPLLEVPPVNKAQNDVGVAQITQAANDGITAQSKTLPALYNIDNLITAAKPGPAAATWQEAAKVGATLGILSPEAAARFSSQTDFTKAVTAQALATAKATFTGRITNADIQMVQKTTGQLTDPEASVRFGNNMQIAAEERKVAEGKFAQSYQGPPAQFNQAWLASPDGSKSMWQNPVMTQYLPVVKGKPGTASEGMYAVKLPGARGQLMPVTLDPRTGKPVPLE